MKTLKRLALGAMAIGACSLATIAHVDDPKEKDREPAFRGAGWIAAQDGDQRGVGGGFSSSGVDLQSWISIDDFNAFGPINHGGGNDCWGYVSPSGREYALMGLSDGTAVVEITNPADATIIEIIGGPNSLWRDVKTYQQYAYVVSEGGGGIQVIDLGDVDNGNVSLVNTAASGATHNVAIDTDSGFLYRCGGGDNGLRIYSLASPTNPVFVGDWNDRYVHDAQIITTTEDPPRQLAYCCGGLSGGHSQTGLYIVDVTNKASTNTLSFAQESFASYSHQGWLSDDRTLFYLGDEINEQDFGLPSTTHVFDVTDPENPVEVNTFSNGNSASTHNLYTVGDLIFEANYRSGLRVYDAEDALNPVEIGFFDTYPESDSSGYAGLWNVYPYFPSGSFIGSDLQRGLFVWTSSFNNIDIAFPSGQPEYINPAGQDVAVVVVDEDGSLDPSSPMLHFDAGNGAVTVPLAHVGGDNYLASFPAIECGNKVDWYISASTTAGSQAFSPSGAPAATYEALAAIGEIEVMTDNFETDQGWTTEVVGASSGFWERGVPVNDGSWQYDPTSDGDGSGSCYLTQNQFGNTDVDDGSVRLYTPTLDLSASPITVSYEYFLNLTNENGEDKLLVEISSDGGAGPWTEIARHDTSGGTSWRSATIDQSVFDGLGLTLTDNMRIRFTANDGEPQSINESGVDGFTVAAVDCSTPGLVGDIDGDGTVGTTDLLAMLAVWGDCDAPCPPTCDGDIAGDDCTVGVSDLLLLLANWTG